MKSSVMKRTRFVGHYKFTPFSAVRPQVFAAQLSAGMAAPIVIEQSAFRPTHSSIRSSTPHFSIQLPHTDPRL